MIPQQTCHVHSRGAVLFMLLAMVGCSGSQERAKAYPTSPELMVRYGCPTCHVIPGVPGAIGKVGPSLATLSQRSYLAGGLPNTPSDLQFWLQHPQSIRPGSAMPEMNLSEIDARRIALYLESN